MEKEARVSLTFVSISFIIAIFFTVLAMAVPSFHTYGDNNETYLEEDQSPFFTYNFSANVTNAALDPINYSILEIKSDIHSSEDPSFYYWITLDPDTGVMYINASQDNETGRLNFSIFVSDEDNLGESRPFYFIINATNDFPNFTNIALEYNLTENINFIDYINATDEEEYYPIFFDINFTSCSLASWSTRDPNNCTLLSLVNVTNLSAIMNYTPSRDDAGNYTANISIRDYGNSSTCPYNFCSQDYQENKTRYYSEIIVFNVLSALLINVTDCQNAIFLENQSNTCQINVSAQDSDNTLNMSSLAILRNFPAGTISNTSWFFSPNESIATNFVKTVEINFTPQKTEVGNWTINFTVKDINSGENITEQIFIYVNRTYNDAPEIYNISSFTVSTNQTRVVNITVHDDDLLIPDKNVTGGGFNESMTFNVTVLNQSNHSQILPLQGFDIEIINMPLSGTNKTEAKIEFTPNSSEVGNYTINITVNDYDNSTHFTMFNISIITNNAPVWNETLDPIVEVKMDEDDELYLNISLNVTDPDGDALNFTFSSDSTFTAFTSSFNTTDGILNFSVDPPADADVGYHNVTITASDGYLTATQEFNFTIQNIPDNSTFGTFSAVNASLTTLTSGGNLTAQEGNATSLNFFINDDDFAIPEAQKVNFYKESITINLTIEGKNTTLFTFSRSSGFPTESPARTRFESNVFTPSQSDIGFYNITVNATSSNNESIIFTINLTIVNAADNPVLDSIGNRNYSILETIYIDFSATDNEDINETAPGSNITFTITNLTDGGGFLNFSSLNASSGILNFSINQTNAGHWTFNISVNDSSDLRDSEIINISIYDYPVILSPIQSFIFNMIENVSIELNFIVNSTIGYSTNETINYTLYINGIERNSTLGNSNGTAFLWDFYPNFTDETTCSGAVNITLNVSNLKLSNETSWTLNVNYTNHPLQLSNNISDTTGGATISLTLSDYFTDHDATDSCRNQTIGFTRTTLKSSGGTITTSITNWTADVTPSISFTASSSAEANYTITAFEYTNDTYSSAILGNTTSNNFTVEHIISITTVTTPSGGGGSSVRTKPVSLKILVPDPISAKRKDKLIIPLGVWNNGEVELREIVLSSVVAKDGLLRSDLISSFDISFIDKLKIGERRNVTLIVDIDTQATGLFEITITGTVKDPEYTDFAKIFIEIEEEEDVLEIIIFTEELIIGNPECAELKELIDEAKALAEQGETELARIKTEEVLSACKRAIAQPPSSRALGRLRDQLFNYISFTAIIAFTLGLLYYYYKRYKLKKAMAGYEQNL